MERRIDYPPNKIGPGNPIGEWIDVACQARGIAIRELGKILDLPGIYSIRTHPAEEISVYTMQVFLEGTQVVNSPQEEVDRLVEAVVETVERTMEVRGKLYIRIPPIVAKSEQKKLGETTFTDTQLVKELGFTMPKITLAKKKLGVNSLLVSLDQLDLLRTYLEGKNKDKKLIEGMPLVISQISGFSEQDFNTNLVRKTCLPRQIVDRIKKGENPTPQVLGVLLEKLEPTQEEVELLIDLWLPIFRDNISYVAIGNEFHVTRERVRQLAKKIREDDGKLTWEQIEILRDQRSGKIKHSGFAHSGRPRKLKQAREVQDASEVPARTSPNLDNVSYEAKRGRERPRKSAVVDTAKVTSPRVGQKITLSHNGPPELPEEVVSKIDLGHPDVLSDTYLNSLTGAERSAVEKLRGTSFLYPVKLNNADTLVLEYLMKEQIYPHGARFKRRNGSANVGFYLDYLSPIL